MHIPFAFESRSTCCDQKHEITSDMINQMLPGILEDFRELCKRQKAMRPSKRIRILSRPTVTKPKYLNSCPCRENSTRVEIVRMEQPVYTRTEQLAYPRVRSVDLVRASRLIILIIVFFVGFIMVACSKLLKLKEEPSYSMFHPVRKKAINAMINKSLHSLYSRLSNTQPPKKPKKVHKWNEDEWDVHRHYINLMSRPKKVLKREEPIIKSRTLSSLKRINRLAKPKQHVEDKPVEWHLTNSQKHYIPSNRLEKMAKPKVYPIDDFDGFKVKPSALLYKASHRITILAIESRRRSKMVEVRENPFQTSQKALKAKTTPRMIDLSRPRQFYEANNRPHPFGVSRKALSYRITNRIKELAKPKVYAK